MIKLIDIDKLFDDYISDYVYKNIGKVKPEEIENQMPVLYEKFGRESLKELDGKTPKTYYESYSAKELLNCLKEHLIKGVSVSDFLCEAIINNGDSPKEICGQLLNDNNEQYVLYLMNILCDINAKPPLNRYVEFLLLDYPESISELASESLRDFATEVKDILLESYPEQDKSTKEKIADILSCSEKDERVFNLLIEAFKEREDNIPLYCAYLSKYGDERALPFLLQTIERQDISYADFEELRFAIESLGGEYTKQRDFSKDKTFSKIKGAKRTRHLN